MRVNQIYDIDNKTYLIRLQRTEEKKVLLLESGNRFHTTGFEWPKNVAPSGFTMKLRKHLKNKRLERLVQLGTDRIIALQFGTNEATYHVVVELYDRGNILLCDHEWTILNVLRPHVEGEEVRFAVREKYPTDRAKSSTVNVDVVKQALETAQGTCNLRGILNPITPFGPSLIDHVLEKHGLSGCRVAGAVAPEPETIEASKGKRKNKKESQTGRKFDLDTDLVTLMSAIQDAEQMMAAARTEPSKGYIIQREERRPSSESGKTEESFFVSLEYHPYAFLQNAGKPAREFESFDAAVDEYYSTQEGQKIDLKAMQQEKEALKKLSNVRTDHAKRLTELSKTQAVDRIKAELITRNQVLVDKAIMAIQHALAGQMSWDGISSMVNSAQSLGDPLACSIKGLKLQKNSITMHLADPYAGNQDEEDEEDVYDEEELKLTPMLVDINLDLTAFANARRYYDQKRSAAKKEQKTIDASAKALKSAERRTQQTLKEVKTISSISKARKVYWFEKFFWFISSENYLVIGGRDQQQNELIVKRYMRPNDVYVHAEIHGATSVVIRNPNSEDPVPPKTLLEAGTMAISYSVAWEAKIVTSAYWVKSDQVSKTAPTGEYLGTGSFMIRGKKNFLPPCHLILGLSFLFKLEEGSVERHRGERKVRNFDEEAGKLQILVENSKLESVAEEVEQEIALNDDDGPSSSEEEDAPKFPDTHIKVDHDTGKVQVKTDPKLDQRLAAPVDPDHVIYLGDDKPYIIPAQPKKAKGGKQQKPQPPIVQRAEVQPEEGANKGVSNQVKRGQKAKLKKIKEKYGDQDEEEREMRMKILKSDGQAAKDKKKKAQDEEIARTIRRTPQAPKPREADDEDETPAQADLDMLEALTGQPVEEDELLFAIPVVAPYQALQNYK